MHISVCNIGHDGKERLGTARGTARGSSAHDLLGHDSGDDEEGEGEGCNEQEDLLVGHEREEVAARARRDYAPHRLHRQGPEFRARSTRFRNGNQTL